MMVGILAGEPPSNNQSANGSKRMQMICPCILRKKGHHWTSVEGSEHILAKLQGIQGPNGPWAMALQPWRVRAATRFIQHVRWHMHSAKLQKFFTNKTHKKYCSCGKPSALLLEQCSYCGASLNDQHIAPMKRDPLLAAVLGENTEFQEMHRSFQLLVLKNRYPVGDQHLLVLPKSTFYDIRQLRKRDAALLEKMYQKGLECLKVEPGTPVACGFSYPSDYNHLHLHMVYATLQFRGALPTSRLLSIARASAAVAAQGVWCVHTPCWTSRRRRCNVSGLNRWTAGHGETYRKLGTFRDI